MKRVFLLQCVHFSNAFGNPIPSYLLFPGVNFKLFMLNECLPGTVSEATKSEWMNVDIFINILKHFQTIQAVQKDQSFS